MNFKLSPGQAFALQDEIRGKFSNNVSVHEVEVHISGTVRVFVEVDAEHFDDALLPYPEATISFEISSYKADADYQSGDERDEWASSYDMFLYWSV